MSFHGPLAPPIPVTGLPTRIAAGEVADVGADGTVTVRARNSRRSWRRCVVPVGYTPAIGHLVLVTELDGDPQRPVVLGRYPQLP